MPEIMISHADLAELSSVVLSHGQRLRFGAPGHSMFPFIRDGDQVEVMPCEPAAIRPLDVLLFTRAAGGVAVHRVIRRFEDAGGTKLLLRGDAPPRFDEVIPTSQVLGKVVAVIHAGRRVDQENGWLRLLVWLWVALAPLSQYAFRAIVRLFHWFRGAKATG